MKKLLIFMSAFFVLNMNANAELVEYSYSSSTGSNSQPNNIVKPVTEQKIEPVKQYRDASQPIKGFLTLQTFNPANSTVKFLYYIPQSLINSDKPFPVIAYIHGLGGENDFWVSDRLYEIADKYGFGIIAPGFRFDENDFRVEKSYQYPKAWAGDALIRMCNKAKGYGLNYSKLYLVGFSAGAQFVSRFSFLRPDVIEACAILGNGAKVKPEIKTNVKYFVGIGIYEEDFRLKGAEYFLQGARDLGFYVDYRQYSVGHETPDEEMKDVADFFVKVKNGQI